MICMYIYIYTVYIYIYSPYQYHTNWRAGICPSQCCHMLLYNVHFLLKIVGCSKGDVRYCIKPAIQHLTSQLLGFSMIKSSSIQGGPLPVINGVITPLIGIIASGTHLKGHSCGPITPFVNGRGYEPTISQHPSVAATLATYWIPWRLQKKIS